MLGGRRGGHPRKLVVTGGPCPAPPCPLRSQGTLIGRSPDALVLGDDYASGRHARIFGRKGRWLVGDLGSTNGTFVDAGIRSHPLEVGDDAFAHRADRGRLAR